MTIDTRLAEIRARVEAATEGPWTPMEYDHNPGDQGVPILGGGERGSMAAHLTAYTMTLSNVDQSEADAEFIAASRTDLPALLAAVEAVLELHLRSGHTRSVGFPRAGQWEHYCVADQQSWPCETITALTAALEVEG